MNPLGCFSESNVWVSGVTGFKGGWLAEWLLALGARVRGFSLAPPCSPSLFEQLGLRERIAWDDGDLRDSAAVEQSILTAQPGFVFHLAAQPLVRTSYREPVSTWATNVLGTVHVMQALRKLNHPTVAVLITTDKCYENREWLHGYREEDALGGFDPYSSSKAACELAIGSWRRSFFDGGPVRLFSARAGNVIGGGDWAEDRIVPDAVRALSAGKAIPVRNKTATRPWQHVLEPLGGYLHLAALGASSALDHLLTSSAPSSTAFNFGPELPSNQTVGELINEMLRHWPGQWKDASDASAPHEAGKLNLSTDKAFHLLGWRPRWNFKTTVAQTVAWYRSVLDGSDPARVTQEQIEEYAAASPHASPEWCGKLSPV